MLIILLVLVLVLFLFLVYNVQCVTFFEGFIIDVNFGVQELGRMRIRQHVNPLKSSLMVLSLSLDLYI